MVTGMTPEIVGWKFLHINGKYMNIIISDPIISGSISTGIPSLWGYTTQKAGGYTRMGMNQLYADFAKNMDADILAIMTLQ